MNSSQRFVFHTKTLEVADGKDGFLRGRPDPAIIYAVYAVHAPDTYCVGRSISRFSPESDFPCVVAPTERVEISKRIDFRNSLQYVVIAASVEENNGDGIRAIYGALEHHPVLSIWPLADDNPSPIHVLELATESGAWFKPERAGLLCDGMDIAKSFDSDTWVGAVAWRIPGSHKGIFEYRLPFWHRYGVNNWTAICEARID